MSEIRPGKLIIPADFQILHVDDDLRILQLVRTMLRISNFNIDSQENPRIALEMLRRNPRNILITDGTMPQMPGEELSYIVRQERPETAILLLSGDIENHQKYPGLFDAEEPKPFRAKALNDAVVRAFTNSQRRLGLIP